jgi:hypothetical protein
VKNHSLGSRVAHAASVLPAADEALVLRTAHKAVARVEIARSFSYKLNVAAYGGPQYESRDFFASEKSECALEDAAEVSAALYQFCRSEVMKAVNEYVAEMKSRQRKTA